LKITVRIIDKSIPVATGKIRTTLSFFNIMSPGSLNIESFGNSNKMQPIDKKTRPRISKNLAGLCTENDQLSLLIL
jgi:hypothetical protein